MNTTFELKYWNVEEIDAEQYRISLKEPNLLSNFTRNKFIILFEKVNFLGFIPIYSNIKLFKDRIDVQEYFFTRNRSFIDFQDDIEISFKEHSFEYPFTGLIEDNFNKRIIIKFKNKRYMKKFVRSLETKFDKLLTGYYGCV